MQQLIRHDELSPLHVLVIDPERELIEFLRSWLEPARCQVEGCLSGREGREMARRTRPNLIILELLLPDMDGLELCRQLHAEATLRERPLLVLTQLDTRQVQLQAQEAGASMVMAKPFSFLGLLSAIEFLTHRLPPGKGFAYPSPEGFLEHVLRPRHVPSWLRPLPTQRDTFPCPFCSAELHSGDNYCLTCGKWLPSEA